MYQHNNINKLYLNMQTNKRTIRQMREQLKAFFPGEYALVVAEKLRQTGLQIPRRQVYKFFNNLPVSKRQEIYTAAIQVLLEERERNEQIEAILKESPITII